MSLKLTPEDKQILRALRVCQPYRGTGAQYVLVPARYHSFFEPLLNVPIDMDCEHGATLVPFQPQQHVLRIARTQIGLPFDARSRPSESPTKFSCSAYTKFVFAHLGIDLPHPAIDQSDIGCLVDPSEAEVGHLLFYGGKYAIEDADRTISHVAIKSGTDRIIHGSSVRGQIVEHRYRDRKVLLACNPYPTGKHLLLTLPRMIPDVETALGLVRYWQRKKLGR